MALGAGGVLGLVHAQAQAEALRLFGDGPAAFWQPRRPTRAAVGCVVLAAAVLAAVVWFAIAALAPADLAAKAVMMPAIPVEVPPSEDFVDAEPTPPPAGRPQPAPPRQAALPASLVVSRSGAIWRIDATSASRLDAAQQLAQLSGSPLLGATDLIAQTQPLDLRWQGRDLSHAWQEVLGPDLNYALQCRRDRCQAWIVAAAAPGVSVPVQPVPPQTTTQSADGAPRPDAGDVPDRISHD